VGRLSGQRLVSAFVLTALVFAGTAFASPQVRRFVATAIDAVTSGFGSEGGGGSAEIVGQVDEAPATQTDGTAGTEPTSPGDGAEDGPSRGPAVDGRPPGTPNGGTFAPGTPPSVTAIPGASGQIEIAWSDVNGERGYRVERSIDGHGGWATVGTPGQDVTTLVDAGLLPGTTYYYRVVATDGDVESAPSDVVSATTPIDPPSATVVLVTGSSSSQIDLAWTDVLGETGFRIERSADGGGGWVTIATTGQDVTTASDAGLAPATTYLYRVFATNAAGDSPSSDVVAGTTAGESGGAEPAGDESPTEPADVDARRPS
jgi:hypothetical protein